MTRFFGQPDSVRVGQLFIDRRDLHESFVHRPLQAGISGTRADGADSIVVSGGYVDDEDHGDYIIYTGHGGNDPNSRGQIADQSPDATGNAGLITSMIQGLPVRVVRGPLRESPYAPKSGYQYAGLFAVTSHWMDVGRDGFLIARFRLDRLPEQEPLHTREQPDEDPAFATSTVTRRIRDTALSREVKAMYGQRCQVCDSAIPGYDGRTYSEGAHVRPLGRPHLGADKRDNLLCLCPNHHTQLDLGGMVILEDMAIADSRTLAPFAELTFRTDHSLALGNAAYHRQLWTKRT
ncbi:MAG: hypothetical protein JWP70_1705 [Leifsonia sp.]|nr:hypothetical protein [Leifsonia sp.]MDQ1588523.1 putative restriction endonuclease [Microbacteriaceae bacterium]